MSDPEVNPFQTTEAEALPPTGGGGEDGRSCPRCGAKAVPKRSAITCGQCQARFLLLTGPALEEGLEPPPVEARPKKHKVGSSGLLFRRFAELLPESVVEGPLDPFIGRVAMQKKVVPYTQVRTVAIWRSVDVKAVVGLSLLPIPLSILLLLATISEPMMAIMSVPVTLLTAWAMYEAVGTRSHFMKVTGTNEVLVIRFDRPFYRRRSFFETFLRRSGIAAEGLRIP